MNKKITKRAPNARLHPILLGLGFVPAALFGPAAHADINVDTTVTVPGSQSSPWNVGSLLRVGNNGAGRLTIAGGGIVTSTSGQIGFAPTADGLVTVTGAGSAWNMTGALTVGMFGRGELQLRSGATMTTAGLGSIAEVVGGTGLVSLDGTGTSWANAGGLYVGREGSGSLSIAGGARVELNGLIVGQGRDAVGNLVVSGGASRLVDASTTTVGTFGRGTARLEAGATAQSQSLMIGFADKNSGVIITGAGSRWDVDGALNVGFQGSGSLALADGGKLTSASGSIGSLAAGTGSVTLTGAGTNWTTTGAVRVGDGGNGTLTLSNGATLNTTNSLLAFGKTGTATVTGAGSTWTDSGSLTIGLTTQGRLDVLDGGTVNVATASITSAAGSSGTLLVSGASSLFNASGTVYVGRTGATGVATLTDGGTLRTGGGFNSVTLIDGTLNIGAAAGTAAAAAGKLDTSYAHFAGSSRLVFNHTSGDLTLATGLNSNAATGPAIVQLAGTTRLTGNSYGYKSGVDVRGGTLLVDGMLGASSVGVAAGGRLGGTGSVLGAVTIADGATLVAAQGKTLGVGSLSLADGARLDMTLGAPAAQALVSVFGDLRLAGTLDLSRSGAAFGSGVYRLIDYTGALTGPGLALGALPVGLAADNAAVQTAVAQQVNLVVGNGSPNQPGLQFWNGGKSAADGAVASGAGTWSATGTNWTNASGVQTSAWAGGMAVFQGNGGAVQIEAPLSVAGLQVAAGAYSFGGAALRLAAPETVVRVGDGGASGGAVATTIAAALEGPGRLVKTDLGTLILTGNNSHAGGTSIKAGILQIASDASLGAAGGGLSLDGGTLKLGGALTSARDVQFGAGGATLDTSGHDALLSGAVAGVGAATLAKRGAGMLTFAGAGTGLGAVTVESGILRIDGGFGAPVLVQSGAQLQGRGTVGSTTVASGAIVAPGNSIGTLTINGDFVQQAGSTYRVELAPNGQTDRLEISGRATLQGGTLSVAKAAGTYAPGSKFTVLHAGGGLTGTYASFEQNQPFVDFKLNYGANDLVLEVRRNDANFCDVSAGANQCAVARSAQKLGDGKRVYDAIVALPNVTAAQQAFDLLSGEVHAAARTALLEDGRLLREALATRLRGAAASGNAAGWTGWAQAAGVTGRNAGDGNAAELEREHRGIQAGGDIALGPGWRVGAAVALGRIDVDVAARRSSAKVEGRQIALYLGRQIDALGLRLGLVQSRYSVDSHRAIAFTNFNEQADARYTTSSRQLFGELGWRLDLDGAELEPFAALAATRLGSARFAETGAANAALDGSTGSQDLTLASMGVRGHADWNLAAGTLRLQGTLAWQRAGGAARHGAAELGFAAGGPAYGVTGAALARNSAVADLGLSLRHGADSSFGVAYAGQWSGQSRDHGLRLSVEHRF